MMLSTNLVGTWTAAAVDSRDLRENTVGAKSWEVAPPRDAARADLEIRRRIEQILEMQTFPNPDSVFKEGKMYWKMDVLEQMMLKNWQIYIFTLLIS